MDCSNVGRLIYNLRKEKGMTQKQLADAMNISDKAISKWERGMGCPDVSLLPQLSQILGVNIERILAGGLEPNSVDGGNMKKVKFYVCPTCGNALTATGEAEVACCGRKLLPLAAKPSDDTHQISVEEVENDYFITINHEMSKAHFISFIACVTYDRVHFVRLYPEQSSEVRIPRMSRGKFYFYCNQHGLWVK